MINSIITQKQEPATKAAFFGSDYQKQLSEIMKWVHSAPTAKNPQQSKTVQNGSSNA